MKPQSPDWQCFGNCAPPEKRILQNFVNVFGFDNLSEKYPPYVPEIDGAEKSMVLEINRWCWKSIDGAGNQSMVLEIGGAGNLWCWKSMVWKSMVSEIYGAGNRWCWKSMVSEIYGAGNRWCWKSVVPEIASERLTIDALLRLYDNLPG